MIHNCGMIEFPFQGNFFSWMGRRKCGRKSRLVKLRLDRTLCNEDWHNIFSHTIVEYLKLWGSDHNPVLLLFKIAPRDSINVSYLIKDG